MSAFSRAGVLAAAIVAGGCGASPPPATGASTASSSTGSASDADAETVSGRQARQLVAEGAVLLDVRSGLEYELRHLDGAASLPVDELERRAHELDPERPVVVYCLSGHRSAEAGRILRRRGFRHVYDLGSMLSY